MSTMKFTSWQDLDGNEVANSAYPPGLVLVKTVTASSGSEFDVDGVFSNDFENYRVVISGYSASSAGTEVNVQFKYGSNVIANNYYTALSRTAVSTNTFQTYRGNPQIHLALGLTSGSTYTSSSTFEVLRPYISDATNFYGQSTSANLPGDQNITFGGMLADTNACTGMKIKTSTGTFTSIKVSVYGYNQ